MITVTRRYRFSASHRLHLATITKDENVRLYGKCNNPHGHGHDYILEVTCSGPLDVVTGLIVPVAELDRLVEAEVIEVFAFSNVNLDIPAFKTLVATTENMATVIAAILQQNWQRYVGDTVLLVRVHIQETDRNGFELRIGAKIPSTASDLETVAHA